MSQTTHTYMDGFTIYDSPIQKKSVTGDLVNNEIAVVDDSQDSHYGRVEIKKDDGSQDYMLYVSDLTANGDLVSDLDKAPTKGAVLSLVTTKLTGKATLIGKTLASDNLPAVPANYDLPVYWLVNGEGDFNTGNAEMASEGKGVLYATDDGAGGVEYYFDNTDVDTEVVSVVIEDDPRLVTSEGIWDFVKAERAIIEGLISTLAARVTTLEGQMTTANQNIANNAGAISDNADAITAANTAISEVESDVSDNAGAITAANTAIGEQATQLSDHENRVVALENATGTVTLRATLNSFQSRTNPKLPSQTQYYATIDLPAGAAIVSKELLAVISPTKTKPVDRQPFDFEYDSNGAVESILFLFDFDAAPVAGAYKAVIVYEPGVNAIPPSAAVSVSYIAGGGDPEFNFGITGSPTITNIQYSVGGTTYYNLYFGENNVRQSDNTLIADIEELNTYLQGGETGVQSGVFEGALPNNGDTLYVRFSTDGGSTWTTGSAVAPV